MSLKAKFKKNASNPKGLLGAVLISRMNIGTHSLLSEFALGKTDFNENDRVLDIGCGGGANLKRMLALCERGKVFGVDCSEVSVKKSKRVNKRAIRENRCEVKIADVLSLPFEDNVFDKVTAFETVYFWRDIENAFREVFRVTANGGSFTVVQETEGDSENARKTLEMIKDMKFYKADELAALMQKAGFTDAEIIRHKERDWFIVRANKKTDS